MFDIRQHCLPRRTMSILFEFAVFVFVFSLVFHLVWGSTPYRQVRACTARFYCTNYSICKRPSPFSLRRRRAPRREVAPWCPHRYPTFGHSAMSLLAVVSLVALASGRGAAGAPSATPLDTVNAVLENQVRDGVVGSSAPNMEAHRNNSEQDTTIAGYVG